MNFGDNVEATFGASNDLKVYHSGTHSYMIQRGTGNLYIQQTTNDADITFTCDDGSGGNTPYLTLDGSAKTIEVSVPMNIGVDDTGHDVKFYGDASGEYMQWDASEAKLKIVHTDEAVGLEVYTNASAQTTEPQLKVGRNVNEWWGAYCTDRTAHLVHRQDETSGSANTSFEIWDSNTTDSAAYWAWKHANGSGGSMVEKMRLTKAGVLTLGTPLATDQQKHLAWFEIAGFGTGDGTNYEISVNLDNDTAPFSHNVSTGSAGTTAITVQNIMRSGGTVMTRAGTIKRWTGWATTAGSSTANVALFKITPARNDNSDVAPVLIDNVSYTAVGNAKMLDFNETEFTDASVEAGDIVVTGIKCENTKTTYFSSTLEIEF